MNTIDLNLISKKIANLLFVSSAMLVGLMLMVLLGFMGNTHAAISDGAERVEVMKKMVCLDPYIADAGITFEVFNISQNQNEDQDGDQVREGRAYAQIHEVTFAGSYFLEKKALSWKIVETSEGPVINYRGADGEEFLLQVSLDAAVEENEGYPASFSGPIPGANFKTGIFDELPLRCGQLN